MVTNDVVYDESRGLRLDAYLPDRPSGALIICIHGGGFFQGDKAKDADLGQAFAKEGYITLVPNYRLAPEHLYPAPVEDLQRLLAWLPSSGYAVAPGRIGVFGSSAGGNLATELALCSGFPAVSWSGIIEMDDWLQAHPQVVPQRRDPSASVASSAIDQSGQDDPFYKWFLLNYFGGEDAAAQQRAHDASVLHRVTDRAGPMLLVNSLDEFVPTSGVMRLQQALTDKGVASTAQFVAGTQHAKGYAELALPGTLEFFRQHLRRS